MKFRISGRAADDLEAIKQYTVDNWGSAQAKLYVSGLLGQVKRMSRHPEIGRQVDASIPGIRMVPYQSHTIYYQVNGDILDIVRILHGRMNPPNHL